MTYDPSNDYWTGSNMTISGLPAMDFTQSSNPTTDSSWYSQSNRFAFGQSFGPTGSTAPQQMFYSVDTSSSSPHQPQPHSHGYVTSTRQYTSGSTLTGGSRNASYPNQANTLQHDYNVTTEPSSARRSSAQQAQYSSHFGRPMPGHSALYQTPVAPSSRLSYASSVCSPDLEDCSPGHPSARTDYFESKRESSPERPKLTTSASAPAATTLPPSSSKRASRSEVKEEDEADDDDRQEAPSPRRRNRRTTASSATAHSIVERRYRQSINTKMDELIRTIKTARLRQSGVDQSTVVEGESPRVRRVDILQQAIDYVHQSEQLQIQMQQDIYHLREQNRALESRSKCENCSLLHHMVKLNFPHSHLHESQDPGERRYE